jgi:hypothetical protein
MVALTAAALACTSAPSLAQTGPEPAASSQGLLEEPGFIVESLVIPEGFTAGNISGYYLEHDKATDTWTAEFVFESNFTEQGYSGGGTYDGGDGFTGREIISGQAVALDDGVRLGAGPQTTTGKSKVTKTTSTGGQLMIKMVGLMPVIIWVKGTTTIETTESESTTTTRAGRLTNGGAEGKLPPPK